MLLSSTGLLTSHYTHTHTHIICTDNSNYCTYQVTHHSLWFFYQPLSTPHTTGLPPSVYRGYQLVSYLPRHTPHHTTPHLNSPHLTSPHHTSSQHTKLHNSSPHHTTSTPHHTTAHHTTSHHTTPHSHYITPHHTTAHHTTSTPHHTTPTLYHTTPHHTTPHHTAPTPVDYIHSLPFQYLYATPTQVEPHPPVSRPAPSRWCL